MKVRKHLLAILLGGIALSCSKHDDNSIELKGEATWVTLSLGKTKTYGSSSGNSTAEEKKINTVDIYLFTPDAILANSKLEKYIHFGTPEINASITPAFQTTTAAKYMVVLVNAPTAHISNINSGVNLDLNDNNRLTLGKLLPDGIYGNITLTNAADFSSYANNINGGNFMMINENPTTLVTFPLQHDMGALSPITINVERIVSKVIVWYSASTSLTFGNANDGVSTNVISAKIWLDNTNMLSYIILKVTTEIEDPNFENYNVNNFLALGDADFSNVSPTTLALDGNASNPLYCFENTIKQDYSVSPKVYAFEDNTTNLILQLQLNGGTTFYMTKKGELTTNFTHVDGIQYTYVNGYCYYRIYLKRPSVTIPGSSEDAYGMLRNRLYDVTINSIGSIGSHRIAPLQSQPILTANLLNVDIYVKDWVVQSNVIDIP